MEIILSQENMESSAFLCFIKFYIKQKITFRKIFSRLLYLWETHECEITTYCIFKKIIYFKWNSCCWIEFIPECIEFQNHFVWISKQINEIKLYQHKLLGNYENLVLYYFTNVIIFMYSFSRSIWYCCSMQSSSYVS